MEKLGATSSDALVLSHFSRQIFQALGYPDRSTAIIKRKWRVAATSVAYFHQFYEVNSLIEHDPRLVMLSCIFLAGKAEDNFVNIQELFKIYPKFPESRILECEIILLESLNFYLKVFHPQNCVYSIIADIKRYTLENATANATANATNGSNDSNEAALKTRLYTVTGAWLAASELNLCVLQSTGLVAKVNPLIVAICVLKLAAPTGLSEILNFDQYLEDKFGPDFLRENITNGVLSVGECLRKGQAWSGAHSDSVENSMMNESSDNSAELLSKCMKELKLKNKWKREVQQK